MVARRRFVFAEKMYRRLAAEAGVHSTTIRVRMLAAGDEAAHLPARSVDGRVWPGVGCCRDTVVKVLRAAGRR